MSDQASNWQQQIEGEWHGAPSVFDAEGNHTGWSKVYRSSVYEDGKVKPYISARYPLAESGAAIQELVDRKAKGKVVVSVAD